VGPIGKRRRLAVWTSRRGTHLGSGHVRPRQQTGHMIASDRIHTNKLLQPGGRPHMGPSQADNESHSPSNGFPDSQQLSQLPRRGGGPRRSGSKADLWRGVSGPPRASSRPMHLSKQGCDSIMSGRPASSAYSSLGWVSAIRLRLLKPAIHLVTDSLICVKYNFPALANDRIKFRDQGDVHDHSCQRRLDRLRWANQAD